MDSQYLHCPSPMGSGYGIDPSTWYPSLSGTRSPTGSSRRRRCLVGEKWDPYPDPETLVRTLTSRFWVRQFCWSFFLSNLINRVPPGICKSNTDEDPTSHLGSL